MTDKWESLQNTVVRWANERYPNESVVSKLKKLEEEVGELTELPSDLLEYADCFMVLMTLADWHGFSMDDIFFAILVKLGANGNDV